MESQLTHSGFITSSIVKERGRSEYYKMLKEAREGNVVCVRRGVYASWEQLADTMIDLDVIVPGGVLCLLSAWHVYGLTTSLPQAYHVAVKRGRKITLPAFPQIELHHVSEPLFMLGVEEKVISNHKVKIYNLERCVCDAVKFRNKIGMDVCAEVVNNYLNRPDWDLTRLMDYAAQLKVHRTLERYLEVKL
jgi:predicted transcriptional regulator of viral defense system